MNDEKCKRIIEIREINENDKMIKLALEIKENFKILTYSEVMAIIEPKISILTIKKWKK